MADRITSAYIEGKSNFKKTPGFSEVMFGDYISKADYSCEIHSLTEQVRNQVGFILYKNRKHDLLNNSDLQMFNWIASNIFSYSSFCFMKSNTEEHAFSKHDLAYIDSNIASNKALCGGKATDFVTYEEGFCLYIDSLRIMIRSLEAKYWEWSYDPRVISHLRKHMELDPQGSLLRHQNIVTNGSILNRLSSAIFWINRNVYKYNFSSTSEEIQWSGKQTSIESV